MQRTAICLPICNRPNVLPSVWAMQSLAVADMTATLAAAVVTVVLRERTGRIAVDQRTLVRMEDEVAWGRSLRRI